MLMGISFFNYLLFYIIMGVLLLRFEIAFEKEIIKEVIILFSTVIVHIAVSVLHTHRSADLMAFHAHLQVTVIQ